MPIKRIAAGYRHNVLAHQAPVRRSILSLGEKQLALEIKASQHVHGSDFRALAALTEDGPVKHRIVVCMEDHPRRLDGGIEILPWRLFIERLWAGDLLGLR